MKKWIPFALLIVATFSAVLAINFFLLDKLFRHYSTYFIAGILNGFLFGTIAGEIDKKYLKQKRDKKSI
jgi:hypothetical protein